MEKLLIWFIKTAKWFHSIKSSTNLLPTLLHLLHKKRKNQSHGSLYFQLKQLIQNPKMLFLAQRKPGLGTVNHLKKFQGPQM